MAGGLFEDRPFEVNPKCLIISGALAGLYWVLPPKNPWVVGGYMIGGYVALAWYDEMYNCETRLSANTILHDLTASIKPAVDSATGVYGKMRPKKPCCGGCAGTNDKKPCEGNSSIFG